VRTSIYGWIRAAALLALLTGCAAERLHRDGMAAIDRGDYEQGIADLQQALAQDPGNIAYKLDYEARRDSAVQKLIALAESARVIGQFDLAVADYQRALAIDPSNLRAQKGLELIAGDKRHGAEPRMDEETDCKKDRDPRQVDDRDRARAREEGTDLVEVAQRPVSLGGAAILAAASKVPEAKAVPARQRIIRVSQKRKQ